MSDSLTIVKAPNAVKMFLSNLNVDEVMKNLLSQRAMTQFEKDEKPEQQTQSQRALTVLGFR